MIRANVKRVLSGHKFSHINKTMILQLYACTLMADHSAILRVRETMPHYIQCPWYCTGFMFPHQAPVKAEIYVER